MKRSRLIILYGIALVLALGAAVMMRNYMAAPPARPKVVVKDTVEKTRVLTVARDVKMGGRINEQALKWTAWPKRLVTDRMITEEAMPDAIEKFVNARTRTPLVAGEPLLKDKLITRDSGLLSALLPKGMRAIAVKVEVATGAGGFIMPGDRVDVLLTRTVGGRTITETVIRNVRVMAIDQSYRIDKDGNKVAESDIRTATLELTPQQAEIVTRVESIGKLALALRSMAELGDSDLKDDMPRLSEKYARQKESGVVTIIRSGVKSSETIN